jgi:hypothetical protein
VEIHLLAQTSKHKNLEAFRNLEASTESYVLMEH